MQNFHDTARNNLVCKITGRSLNGESGYTIHPIFILDDKTFISRLDRMVNRGFFQIDADNIELLKVYAISAAERMNLLTNIFRPIQVSSVSVSAMRAMLAALQSYRGLSLQDQTIFAKSCPKIGSALSLKSVSAIIAREMINLQTKDSLRSQLEDSLTNLTDPDSEREAVRSLARNTFTTSSRISTAKGKFTKRSKDYIAPLPNSEVLAELPLSITQYKILVTLYKMPMNKISGTYSSAKINDLYQTVRSAEISSDYEMEILAIELYLKNILSEYAEDLDQYSDFGINLRMKKYEETKLLASASEIQIQKIEVSSAELDKKNQESASTMTLKDRLAALKARHSI